jgi:hypothetical protein
MASILEQLIVWACQSFILFNYRLLCPSAILLYEGKLFKDSLQQSFPGKRLKKVYRSSIVLTFGSLCRMVSQKIGLWQKIDSYICLTPFAG